MDEPIFTEGKTLRAYPDPDTVFADPALEKYLHPLVTIQLSALDPEWRGQVHLVSPIEPMEGLLGADTTAWHNHWLGTNWLSLQLDQDGRYQLPGDIRYFLFADPTALWQKGREDFVLHYARENRSYAFAKQRYEVSGGLYFPIPKNPREPNVYLGKQPLIEQLGGQARWGNWVDAAPLPAGYTMRVTGETVQLWTESGQPLHFIAGVTGYAWRDSGADWILLFYEPKSRMVLLSFDWS